MSLFSRAPLRAGFAVAALVLCATAASAQEKYPVGTVTLVTHSSPGGGTDVYLREMAPHLQKVLGANVVVENVRGGSGAKAMAHVAQAKADGSMFYGTTPSFINTSLLSKPQFTYADLEPVVNIFMDPQVVYTTTKSDFTTLTELVEAAKAKPGQVAIGVSTPASLDRQVMEQLKKITGIEVNIATHDGGGDLLINVLNGTLAAGIGEVQELRGQIEAGEIRLIATYTEERLENYPDVPTAREQGIDLVVNKFRGIAGPKGLPEDVLQAWAQAIPAVLEVPEFKKWYEAAGLIPTVMDHQEYAKFMTDFVEDQKKFFADYGVTSD
ncbi:Bug family tripartite tricarboxylate transporter substrate binding protein [Faunimonas sp. B44]|uniref:Bug family tripartite tricarboxylate transporter substrate binding protein n=1 Tax=Faunimonas sp. B44 TaxID=3461493 RepID=UPI004044D565